MYSSFEALRKAFVNHLLAVYDQREANTIFKEVVAVELGWDAAQFVLNKHEAVSEHITHRFKKVLDRLVLGEPIQYITGVTHFMGKDYVVNPYVLIPRPETAELIQWVLDDWSMNNASMSAIDIGSGSGIIPIELALNRPRWTVTGTDVSEEALDVARKNALNLGAKVHWLNQDILNPCLSDRYRIIISNPPYIPRAEAGRMSAQVVNHEPHLALFVDDDPLQFYAAVMQFAKEHLEDDGALYFECHEDYAHDVEQLCLEMGWRTDLRTDLQNKPRMLRVVRVTGEE